MKKKKDLDQTVELEQAFQEAASAAAPDPGSARHRKIRSTALGLVVLTLLVAITGTTWWFLDYTQDDGLIYPNVFVYDIDLGGMTAEEAAAAIHAATDGTYAARNLTVELPDSTLILSPANTQASLDVDKLVGLAYGYGREGNRWENTQSRAAAALTSYEPDVLSCLTLDQAYIRNVVDQIAQAAASTLTQTTVTVTGETPALNMTYEEATAQTGVTHRTMTITMGTPDRSMDAGALVQRILDAYAANNFETIAMEYQVTDFDPIDLNALFAEYCVNPVDAILDETDYSITPEVLGYGFDIAELQALVDAAGEGEAITYTFQYLPAAVTKASLEANLFQDTLASVSTNHTNDANRNTNLRLACQAINGKIVRPGETFSFNQTLGERTAEKGYKSAGAYAGGKNVQTIGGGICQVSSTLYYACLKADLEIVQRTNHGFTVSYVPLGMDATVSWGSLDYKFRNNTDYPIRIQASVSGGQVHVKLIGTDDKSYYVKMTYETVDGPYEGNTIYEEYAPNNPEGYTDGYVIQTAYTGRTVKSYRCKYDKETDKLISSTLEATSTYQKRDKIVVKIVDPNQSADPVGTSLDEPEETTLPPETENGDGD